MSSTLDKGNALQAAAYATDPTKPTGLGPTINGLIYFFSVLAFIITCLRAWVRFGSESTWGWDDLLAIGGYVAFVPSNVFGVLATHYGLGAPDANITDVMEIRAIEYFMYYEILYFAASATTKVSITFTVLRLCDKQLMCRRIAIGNAIMMIAAAGISGVFVLTNCRPFDTYWNPDLGTCTYGAKGLASLETVSLIGSSFQMLSDWVSALLPFWIIKNLAMPRRTKFSLIAILGLGIMASIAALARMVFYKYWDKAAYPTGYLYHTGYIVITSELEVGLGIVACSLPPLRKLIKNVFHSTVRSRPGLGGNDGSQYHMDASAGGTKKGGMFSGNRPTELTTMSASKVGKGEWSRLDDDSVKGDLSDPRSVVIRETRVS